MSIIETVSEDEATDPVATFYEADRKDLGYVAPHTKAMCVNPEAYQAWTALVRAIVAQLGKRRFELVTLAAAKGIHSDACRLAHGRKSLSLFDEEQLFRIAADYHDADLSEAEVAMMEFAERIGSDSGSMSEADSLRLREVGFSDREIVDITLAAAARNFFSRSLQALAVDVDVPPGLSDRLQHALLTQS
jgi:uncharacterized peroxidase-related enzyme